MSKPRQPNWRKQAFLLAAVLAVLGSVVRMTIHYERLLSRDGTPVATINDWKRPYWQWRSPHEILYLHDDLAPHATGLYSIWSLDTATGKSGALTSINQKLHTDSSGFLDSVIGNSGWIQLSPNGSNLLWVGDPGPRPQWSWFLFSLNDSRLVKGKMGGLYLIRATSDPPMTRWAWNRGGEEWVALSPEGATLHALVYRTEPPGFVHDIPLNVTKSSIDPDMAFPTTCLGFANDGRLLATYWHPALTDHVDILAFDLAAPDLPVHTYTIDTRANIRSKSEIREMALSPRGDRLAWHFRCLRESPLQWLARWVRSSALDPRLQDELWVSKLDGSGMNMVGFQPCVSGTPSSVASYWAAGIEALRWTPDDSKLSYSFDGKLYTVPASSP